MIIGKSDCVTSFIVYSVSGETEYDDCILLQDDQLCAELYPEVYGSAYTATNQEEPRFVQYSPWSSADEGFDEFE